MAVEAGLPRPLGGMPGAALSSPGASAGGTVSPAHPLWGFSASKGIFLWMRNKAEILATCGYSKCHSIFSKYRDAGPGIPAKLQPG